MFTAPGLRLSLLVGLAITITLLAGGQTPSYTAHAETSAAHAWERLLKLRTTASLLHTTAHPDDEQGAMLARVGRHDGVRTGLLTLNRGEAGDNALGPELFDALGLVRTAELGVAGRYYGLDEQHFTSVVDYGFSKRLDEALERWDRQDVLRDMVRAIRRFRPLVVVSRWQGNDRDGHGQHQAAGALTPEAVRLAADETAFPELHDPGLRPWRVRKLYVGGVHETEPWHVRVDTHVHDPVLGASYSTLGGIGLSMQRSQTSGRFDPYAAGHPLFYRRHAGGSAPANDAAPARERSFFDGLDVTLPGAYALLGQDAPAGHYTRLEDVAREVDAAVAAFSLTDPSAAAPPIARGLLALRQLAADTVNPDVRFVLDVKSRQFEDALAAAAGVSLVAVAEPPSEDSGVSENPFNPPATLGPLSPGETASVRVVAANAGTGTFGVTRLTLVHPGGTMQTDVPGGVAPLEPAGRRSHTFAVTLPAVTEPTRPYFVRSAPDAARYTLLDPVDGRTAGPAASARRIGRCAGRRCVAHRTRTRRAARGESAVGLRAAPRRDSAAGQRLSSPAHENRAPGRRRGHDRGPRDQSCVAADARHRRAEAAAGMDGVTSTGFVLTGRGWREPVGLVRGAHAWRGHRVASGHGGGHRRRPRVHG